MSAIDASSALIRHKRRHKVRDSISAVVVVLTALLLWAIATNENMEWGVVGEYLFEPTVLQGIANTILLAAVAMIVGIVLGFVVAVMRVADSKVLSTLAAAFCWFFRGVPTLVLLILWFNIALIFPVIEVYVPGTSIGVTIITNNIVTTFVAAVIALGLHEAAYMAEIFRSGLTSVAKGQTEASTALGMTYTQSLRRIIVPQAMRVIIPPTGNQFIGMLKATALVAFIGGNDLMSEVQFIYSSSYQVIPLLMVATFWYLVLTTIASVFQSRIERYYNRGFGEQRSRKTDDEADERSSKSLVGNSTPEL